MTRMHANVPPRTNRAEALQYVAILLLVAITVLQVMHTWRTPDASGRYASMSRDFADFYCAGATSNANQNPYLLEPFDVCGTKGPTYHPVSFDAHRAPAPIPGYDVALFKVLAKLPFPTSAIAWLIVSILALLTVVVLIASLSRLPPIIVFAALALPCFRFVLEWGQLVPIAMVAFAVAAFCVHSGRHALAGFAASVALVEPHLGLPVSLAMFVLLPRSRIMIVAACGALALVSLFTLGLSANVEYVRDVIPLQIAAEVPANNQLSLTWVLYLMGVGQSLAIKLGSYSYYVALVAGAWLAHRCARSLDAPELIVLVPPAIAVIGGPFIHSVQIAVAILPALYLAGRSPRYGGYAWAAIVSFGLEWYSLNYLTSPFSAARLESMLVLIAVVAYVLRSRPTRARVALTAASAVGYLALSTALLHVPETALRVADPPAQYAASLGDRIRYSAGEWGVLVRARPATNVSSTRSLLLKLPAWLGLGFLTAAIICLSSGRSRKPAFAAS